MFVKRKGENRIKKAIIILLSFLDIFCCAACDGNKVISNVPSVIDPSVKSTEDSENFSLEDTVIILNMNGTNVRAHLYDNTAVRSF